MGKKFSDRYDSRKWRLMGIVKVLALLAVVVFFLFRFVLFLKDFCLLIKQVLLFAELVKGLHNLLFEQLLKLVEINPSLKNSFLPYITPLRTATNTCTFLKSRSFKSMSGAI